MQVSFSELKEELYVTTYSCARCNKYKCHNWNSVV